jgi:hypothetical protein
MTAIGRTLACFKRAGVGINGILECNFLSKNAHHTLCGTPAASNPPTNCCANFSGHTSSPVPSVYRRECAGKGMSRCQDGCVGGEGSRKGVQLQAVHLSLSPTNHNLH